MLVTLTSPLTHVKDEVKGMVAVTTLLMLVKDELRNTNTLHSQSQIKRESNLSTLKSLVKF